MRRALELESAVHAGWADCFDPKGKVLYRTLLIMTLQMFQQLTGANYFFYVRFLGKGTTDLMTLIRVVWRNHFSICGHRRLFYHTDHSRRSELLLHLWRNVCYGKGMHLAPIWKHAISTHPI